ncbi:hypothetical protein GCM10025867_01400 [Frondihabitans sucicola]|uniref:Muconolactone isomerase domain-containing protein n=1 Tax=Frondihabitans sucicola TaxID=1268041 RepID=A0ABN6XSE4_9MICO|nr:muconolactone Delta-isomerase family protein [Frondihabitans sucicola]BDZ47899.1 hypothetical protein GCM10025867_01400 [Frondihabitans sucicola]
MRYIVVSTNTSDATDLLAAEGERATQLVADGVFLTVWPKADMTGAVVLAEAADDEAIRRALDTMPTIAAEAGTYEIIPLLEGASRP